MRSPSRPSRRPSRRDDGLSRSSARNQAGGIKAEGQQEQSPRPSAVRRRRVIRRLNTADAGFAAAFNALLAWQAREAPEVAAAAAAIIEDVRANGDAALRRLSRRFDDLRVADAGAFEVDAGALRQALEGLPGADRSALEDAAGRIRRFHERQPQGAFEFADEFGNVLGQRVTPLDRVGVYVPGGQAAYPSTALMTVVPARVAGVREVIATVPTPGGKRNAHVLAALAIAGADRVFALGGAQAIAALAYGTETVPKVDKIVGPGGGFVAAAKRLVFGPVGIDSIAGPSEVLVIADGSGKPRWAALDILSQAEHDAAAQAILLCPDGGFLDRVQGAVEELLPTLSRADVIRQSLRRRGALVQVRGLAEACRLANRVAPEHLQLAVADADALLPAIRHAGAIFAGAATAEVLGDYSAGPSHVLPTFGTARYASPLGVSDFQKRSSVLRANGGGAKPLARIAARIARSEGLTAHALAAEARLE